jgi:outer membrane lipoprotein-sorting protein
MRVTLSRHARWLVPGTAIAVTAGVVAAFAIPAAEASPVLPARTPAQLLAEISADGSTPPMTGTVVESTSLGLPQLPGINNPTSLASLLTGSHTVDVYYQDAKHFRLAIPSPAAETDIIRNDGTLWLWDSKSDSVTKYVLPKPTPKTKKVHAKLPGTPALTPQQAANEVLKAVGKTTVVSLQSNVMIAGQASYQLVLAPKDHRSLIGEVTIAIDAQYGVPLRVQVFAKGATSPAFQVGYTNLQFVAPAAANFDFTPPPGATVTVENPASKEQGASGSGGSQSDLTGFGTYGGSWLTVVEVPSSDLVGGLTSGGFIMGGNSAAAGQSGQPDSAPANPGGGPGGVLAGDSQAILNAILGSAKPVHGSWGSGTLVTTSVVSILMTGGEVYIGAVQPSVLYAAVGHTSS